MIETKRKLLTMSQLAKRIKKSARSSGNTLREALDFAGIQPTYISVWEKEKGTARKEAYFSEVARLAEFFDKPIEYFIYEDAPTEEYVIIPKKEYEKMVMGLKRNVAYIREELEKVEQSDLFNVERYTG